MTLEGNGEPSPRHHCSATMVLEALRAGNGSDTNGQLGGLRAGLYEVRYGFGLGDAISEEDDAEILGWLRSWSYPMLADMYSHRRRSVG